MTSPEVDPALWSATQRWLDDLDRPDGAPGIHDLDDGCAPTELDIDDRPHDLDEASAPEEPPLQHLPPLDRPTPTSRFHRGVAVAFAAATVIATVAVTTVLLAMRTEPQTADENVTPSTQISVLSPPPSPAPNDGTGDTPIPFTATASCPPGSTAAQAVAGDDPTRAWVCVRNGVDGQVLHLDLGRTMVITGVAITPGWVGTDASGADQWPAHRVVTRMQWIFNDDAATVVTQATGAVRGEAVQPVPHRGVLASKITAIILETARPPADPGPSTTAAPPGDGLLDSILGRPATPPTDAPVPLTDTEPPLLPDTQPSEPVDATVAVSTVKILGHAPQ